MSSSGPELLGMSVTTYSPAGWMSSWRTVCGEIRPENSGEPGEWDVSAAQARAERHTVAAPRCLARTGDRADESDPAWIPTCTAVRRCWGVRGVVFKAHASASKRAVANGIRLATEAFRHRVNDVIVARYERPRRRLESTDSE